MTDDRYRSGGTAGGKWGCAGAVLFTLPVFLFLMMLEALGDCAPDVPCGKGIWSHVMLPSALFALVTGLSIRWLVNWLKRRD